MNLLLDLLFPKRCVGCQKLNTYFCSDCIQDIKQAELICPFCERPAVGGQTHPICRRKFGLDGLWSLGTYHDPLRTAIKKFKYRYIEELAITLSEITLQYWAQNQPFLLEEIKKSRGENWSIVPVPLHWYRQNSRGFNQSALIAQKLATALGLKYEEPLKRIKYTKPQASLKGSDRRQNLKQAFALAMNHELITMNYLLIDDVWTTGSTLKECCYILKRNGAKKIWALTLAK